MNYSIRLDDLPNRIRPVMVVDETIRILGKGDIAFALSLLALEGFEEELPWNSLELANQRLRLEWRNGFDFTEFEEWWRSLPSEPESEDRAYISFVGYQLSLNDRLFPDEAVATAIDSYYYRTAIMHPSTTHEEAARPCRKIFRVLVETLIYRTQLKGGKAC